MFTLRGLYQGMERLAVEGYVVREDTRSRYTTHVVPGYRLTSQGLRVLQRGENNG